MYKIEKINENAYLELYILDSIYDSDDMYREKLPLMFVLPGGGYSIVSAREAQPVALRANVNNMHAAVLHYTVLPDDPKLDMEKLLAEVEACLDIFSARAEEYYIDLQKIYVLGFSAGGHLASWTSIKFHDLIDRAILAYPAVGFAYQYRKIVEADSADLDQYDLDMAQLKNDMIRIFATNDPVEAITENTPPTFLWVAMDDPIVPATNVIRYALKLHEENVPVELHCYSKGGHGLSLANESTAVYESQINERVASWMDLAFSWLKYY